MPWSLPVLTAVLLGVGMPSPALVETQSAAQVSRHASAAPQCDSDGSISAQLLDGARDYLIARASKSQPSDASMAAWAEFFPRCDRLVHQYASAFRARGVDVDDCMQEVWAQLLRTLPSFNLESRRGQFSSWLYAVVRSKANDILRQKARHSAEDLSSEIERSLACDDADPAEVVQTSAEVEDLHQSLSQLRKDVSPESYRVLQLRHLNAMSVNEVAAALGITAEQVWARDHRMRRKLYQLMTPA